jgi:hypothetical protein
MTEFKPRQTGAAGFVAEKVAENVFAKMKADQEELDNESMKNLMRGICKLSSFVEDYYSLLGEKMMSGTVKHEIDRFVKFVNDRSAHSMKVFYQINMQACQGIIDTFDSYCESVDLGGENTTRMVMMYCKLSSADYSFSLMTNAQDKNLGREFQVKIANLYNKGFWRANTLQWQEEIITILNHMNEVGDEQLNRKHQQTI